MKVYLLLEKANTGKSTIIHNVYKELVDKRGGNIIWKKPYRSKEIISIVHFNNKYIAFICVGDTPEAIREEWDELLKNIKNDLKIDILICACRNRDHNSTDNMHIIFEYLKSNKNFFNTDNTDEIKVFSLDNNLIYQNGKNKYDLSSDYIIIADMC